MSELRDELICREVVVISVPKCYISKYQSVYVLCVDRYLSYFLLIFSQFAKLRRYKHTHLSCTIIIMYSVLTGVISCLLVC